MAPSQTVENYLKAIYHAQVAQSDPKALVPMGHLSSALGVVPGTATTMVKTLAESGLVRYEPYTGVRLTAAGEKLAARVLRRHRLVELFLVQVMGMSWTEVHEEAEQLEHAVSDRVIERMDEMLGRPEVDPHGDPIPGPEGKVVQPAYETLLSCPLGTPVTIRRVLDQDPDFLRFIEESDLKPGQTIRIERRDPAADRVSVRGPEDRVITVGARAAAKVLVQAARAILVALALAGTAAAQTPATASSDRPFEITDNSFLVEEAFNQEANIFQNIFGALFIGDAWAAGVTQEWPLGGQTHQLSYTLQWLDGGTNVGFGDGLVNYRYQAMLEGPGRPAFSPRVSAVLPFGSVPRGLGDGSWGLQINLPFSKQMGDWYWHWNAGLTWLPQADLDDTHEENLTSPFVAGSAIYRVRPMFNLMLESVLLSQELVGDPSTFRETVFTLSPGVRGGWNLGDHQLILGLAIPTTWGDDETETGAFLYASYELPFKR
ncbi:MAG TPA: iron dependent repressor, metal binding and dimerization domain protein [Vicinamibacterales bacterium]|jgi:DtxR family Mn-dependent transcriptional regulator|nr:iron dependent repressor, metal binding and dimerization domain protein [Vicinamibacterales bacterium]